MHDGEHGAPIGDRRCAKSLREAQGLSLRDLARTAGVSAPMLSQVERGETSPTLAGGDEDRVRPRPDAVADCSAWTKSRTSSSSATRTQRVTCPPRRPPFRGADAAAARSASRGDGAHAARRAATGGAGDPPLHEPGSRETVARPVGERSTLVCGSERYELREGDSVTFDADLPHHFENPGRRATTFIAVVTSGLGGA